jgi:hypothetical protein
VAGWCRSITPPRSFIEGWNLGTLDSCAAGLEEMAAVKKLPVRAAEGGARAAGMKGGAEGEKEGKKGEMEVDVDGSVHSNGG